MSSFLKSRTAPKQAETSGVYVQQKQLLSLRHLAKDVHLFAKDPSRSMLLGEVRSRARGRGMEFEEVRLYQPGDDVRSIDWRVTARTGKAHTKLFQEERERPVHILVDQRSSMFFGSQQRFKSVLAAELATILAWSALAGSDRIGGQIVGDTSEQDIRPKRNRQTVLRFLHTVCEFNQQLPSTSATQVQLSRVLEEAKTVLRPGTAVFIISDFSDMNDACEKALSLLGRHCELTLLQVFDPLEKELPEVGSATISDGVEQQQYLFNKQLLKQYKATVEARDAQLKRAANRSRAFFSQVSTDEDAGQFLKRLYAR